jgi:acetyl-CoA synthetase
VAGVDAWSLIDRCEITNLFANPAQIDVLRQSSQPLLSRDALKVRNIVLGEAVPTELFDCAKESLGASVNTRLSNALFGSFAGSCDRWYETPRGSAGRAAPGYLVEIVDAKGEMLSPGSEGRLAIRRDEPPTLVEAAITQSSPAEGWVVGGDVGLKDEDGNIWLSGSNADQERIE